MFIFSKADVNDMQIDQFEITGSTYEPKGDVMFNGSKFNCADRSGLVELAECAALCNDSALDYNEVSCFLFHIVFSYLFLLRLNRQRKYLKKLVKQRKQP
jgi:hypothetical protein